eukprot:TRINITY_DN13575_c0_g1_i1.p1 TRINITY_DN13575_c0_g1~~TRINITY_DN13575_c0_g1_i1.p1  ORF type:complete len:191 (+),score=63.37 TRINITY_DN13575_c0_g1_i1:65-574(+)
MGQSGQLPPSQSPGQFVQQRQNVLGLGQPPNHSLASQGHSLLPTAPLTNQLHPLPHPSIPPPPPPPPPPMEYSHPDYVGNFSSQFREDLSSYPNKGGHFSSYTNNEPPPPHNFNREYGSDFSNSFHEGQALAQIPAQNVGATMVDRGDCLVPLLGNVDETTNVKEEDMV